MLEATSTNRNALVLGLVVWEDRRNYTQVANVADAALDICGVVIGPSGTNSREISITKVGRRQGNPAVAASGEGFFVVWEDWRDGTPKIYGTSVTSEGEVARTDGVLIGQSPNEQTYPHVAGNNSGYLVIWQERPEHRPVGIGSCRVTREGACSQEAPLSRQPGRPNSVKVAANGRGFLVVWEEPFPSNDIRSVLINANADPKDLGAIVQAETGETVALPTVASDGTNFWVTWRRSVPPLAHIEGVQVSVAGDVGAVRGITEPIPFGTYLPMDLAWNGKDFFLIWPHSESPGRSAVRGTIMTRSGEAAHPRGRVLSYGPNSQTTAAVAFNGSEYLVVWQDDRFNEAEGHSALFGTRVSATGKILDPEGIAIGGATNAWILRPIVVDGTEYSMLWGAQIAGGATNYLDGSRMRFALIAGRNIFVQFRDDLSPGGVWQSLPGGPHNSGSVVDKSPASHRIYRLRIDVPWE
ncbi:MAG: hypothetical protein HY735_08670 [Verrucomicrobia bacterium]|nr:hypothetical protein [Verrucomicrobiota bacterium]